MISRRLFLAGAAGTAGAAALLGVPNLSAAATRARSAAPETCELALQNTSLPGEVNAYVTGRDLATDAWVVLKADGSVYRLEEPGAPNTPLPDDCAIPVPAAGSEPKVITLPQMHGARVYFVRDDKLDFFVNPGPSLVEPSFAAPEDPNYGRTWSFCEFTFNTEQLYSNISYVDLVTALPIGLHLEGDGDHEVAPLPDGAVDKIAAGVRDQAAKDGQPWDQLVIEGDGKVLRVVSPQSIMAPWYDQPDKMPFRDVWNEYIDKVWEKYGAEDLKIDLQGGRGVFTGRVSGDVLTFDGGHEFIKPVSKDIFSCNHGPFTNNPDDSDEKKGLLARLAAGFNRSTLLTHPDQPGGGSDDYYQDPITNHWSRVVHANSPIGYAFPYDDVRPDGEPDVSGAAFDGNPRRFTVRVGS
ncbi:MULTISPECIES: glycoside hydrolase family 64 protein [Streptomyces]|uniref:Beta-1,3-glucanase B n=1 Tax=Streptomyces albus (strain ATCC 21838 / DSM 41398 / FERM P-419 / JCM 4703 / NBRC 107858) TaxID=1081613 RepID=A0A0B5EN05_STRA4|nr:glycoside hydrolase family 64 protein [Streptomyces sp. SCSIO ZS0520]AJE82969.1 beta-1,3-glucanase B [Streptomyces albus]AOU77281.1 beta-1,3-glucanase B [Streptomyces albus]AYN33057.1 sugar hydrolase [Streptomyces albus]